MTNTLQNITDIIGKEFSVLDRGYLILLDIMPHPATSVTPDLSVVNCARTSFLGESKGEEADKKLLRYLLKNRHTSPFEQVSFQFMMYAPLVTYWQLLRHRTFKDISVNSQSGRYVPFEEDDTYVPDTWRRQSTDNKQASKGHVNDEVNEYLTKALVNFYDMSYKLYANALELGVSRELARLFLPGFSVYYKWILKVDAHNLMHFLKLRLDEHAQYEIRVYAEVMNAIFKVCMPWTSEAFDEFVLNDK